MLAWIRSRPKTFFTILLLGALLRLVFILQFPLVQGDSEMYSEIARTWLHEGTFGMEQPEGIVPTYVRLPGYPGFLAAIFALGGDSPGMRPAMYAQMLFDLLTCVIIARIALELFSERVAWTAFLLAAVCPFTANYVALPLTETLSIFATALAVLFAVLGLRDMRMTDWVGCGLATALAILLRPDGMILLLGLGLYLLWSFVRATTRWPVVRAGLVLLLFALLPLTPWTYRNWKVFHEFQPLAPRYANTPEEFVTHGFNRWTKTWVADYVSVEDFFWKMPGDGVGEEVDASRLPERAFDSAAQRAETLAVLADYNREFHITPELDARLAALARQRIEDAPLRYYVWLPALRIADMWLRPRIEMLPLETRWWEFDDPPESAVAIAMGALNLLLLGAAMWGALTFRAMPAVALMVTITLLRTVFLGTLENPEPRYTLECYPMVLVLAAVVVAGLSARFRPVTHAELGAEVL
ncbi:MAG TPA: glycosyltransferase family 39 protein [Terriglobales bacterium]|nr:glycosyltransferase family 39 protein [Terriglobales bacterium]